MHSDGSIIIIQKLFFWFLICLHTVLIVVNLFRVLVMLYRLCSCLHHFWKGKTNHFVITVKKCLLWKCLFQFLFSQIISQICWWPGYHITLSVSYLARMETLKPPATLGDLSQKHMPSARPRPPKKHIQLCRWCFEGHHLVVDTVAIPPRLVVSNCTPDPTKHILYP